MEYWVFTLGTLLIAIILVTGMIFLESGWLVLLYFLYLVFITIPGYSVMTRRFHDIGKSGWWVLGTMVPIVSIIALVYLFFDSEPGENKYGPNPKGVEGEKYVKPPQKKEGDKNLIERNPYTSGGLFLTGVSALFVAGKLPPIALIIALVVMYQLYRAKSRKESQGFLGIVAGVFAVVCVLIVLPFYFGWYQ